jgi:hypothetical protein
MAEHASYFQNACDVSATCYCRAEYARIIAVVIAPFKFSYVQRQIFAADLVEAAHNASFQKRPETIDRLSVDGAVNILAGTMPDSPMFFQSQSG